MAAGVAGILVSLVPLEMTSQQPQPPHAAASPHMAQNSSAQQVHPHIQPSQLDSTPGAVGPADPQVLTDRPGCSGGGGVNRSSARGDGRCEPWPEEAADNSHGLYSLHQMFTIVGAHLTHRDIRVLSFLFVDVIDEYERGGIRSGKDFLLALERQGRCDETNFRHILQLLRIITRHDLLPYVTLRKRQAGEYGAVSASSKRSALTGSDLKPGARTEPPDTLTKTRSKQPSSHFC